MLVSVSSPFGMVRRIRGAGLRRWTVKRKVFRSLTRRKNEIGIKECDGFEAVIKERIYNVYRSDYNTVHIIDPATGMSVFNYHTSELLEMDAAKAAVEKFCKTGYSLNRFQEMVKTEEYKTFVDMFDAFELAWELGEELGQTYCQECGEGLNWKEDYEDIDSL